MGSKQFLHQWDETILMISLLFVKLDKIKVGTIHNLGTLLKNASKLVQSDAHSSEV